MVTRLNTYTGWKQAVYGLNVKISFILLSNFNL